MEHTIYYKLLLLGCTYCWLLNFTRQQTASNEAVNAMFDIHNDGEIRLHHHGSDISLHEISKYLGNLYSRPTLLEVVVTPSCNTPSTRPTLPCSTVLAYLNY